MARDPGFSYHDIFPSLATLQFGGSMPWWEGKGKDTDYEGAAGTVDFDENGDVITPIEIWKYMGERSSP